MIKIESIKDIQVLDSGKARYTPEGFMIVPATLARTGIQHYSTDESILKNVKSDLPASLQVPGKIVRMLRGENEVFATDSLASIAKKPVTNNHPPNNISAKDVKDYMVGVCDSCAKEDDEKINGELLIYDARTIEEIKDGKKEISLGYSADWDMISGIDPKYGEYDGTMRNIRANHVAIVQHGRAGKEIRIQDKKGEIKMAERTIGNVKLDIADDKVGVIDALINDVAMARKELVDSKTATTELQKKLDAITGERDTLAAKVKDSVITAEMLDSAVKERTSLIESAKRLHAKIVTDGKPNLDIMKEVVIERTKIDCADKSDDYIKAAFDTLCIATVSDSKAIADALDKGAPAIDTFDAKRDKWIESNKTAFAADKEGK